MNEPNFWEMLLGFIVIFVSMGFGSFLAKKRQGTQRKDRIESNRLDKQARNARKKTNRQHKSR